MVSFPYDEWVLEMEYKTRWKYECTFSDFKRILLETVEAKTKKEIIWHISGRIGVHNDYKRTRIRIMGATSNGVNIA